MVTLFVYRTFTGNIGMWIPPNYRSTELHKKISGLGLPKFVDGEKGDYIYY